MLRLEENPSFFRNKGRYRWFLVAAILLGGIFYVSGHSEQSIELYKDLIGRFSGHPIGTVAVFVPFCILGTLVFIPVILLTLTAGVLFGAASGAAIALCCMLASATISFLLGRKIARQWLGDRFDRRHFYRNLLEAANPAGWKIVLLLRLTPLFPFSPVNFFLGISKVSFLQFISATGCGMLPGVIVFSYLGSLARNITELTLSNRIPSAAEWGLTLLGTLAMIVLFLNLIFYARKALPKRLYPEE